MRWVGFAAGNAKRSREITTEDESASTVAGSVIAFPASYVAKTRPLVERPSRPIVFGNFKKNGVHSEAGKPAQMQIEESPTHSFPPPDGSYRNRQDFCFARGGAGEDKTRDPASDAGAMSNDIFLGEQCCEFALAPAPTKRPCMQRRECGGITGVRFRQDGFSARE